MAAEAGHGSLDAWAERREAASAVRMAASVSATGLTKRRDGFGQTVVPARGSVLASPVLADYDPDPDYFFHWLRDSALVVTAATILAARGDRAADWPRHIADFVGFSRRLGGLSGRAVVADDGFRRSVGADLVRFVRPEAELAAVEGDALGGEVRFNPDGTLDIVRWGRPQNDGPALRALALMDAAEAGFGGSDAEALIADDLEWTAAHAARPCIDLWEDVRGRHYHTLLVQFWALRRGASRIAAADPATARRWRAAATTIPALLDACWSAEVGAYLSRVPEGGEAPARTDIAVVLGVLHAGVDGGRHSVLDDRVAATLDRLAADFAAAYPVNASLPPGHAPALGRFAGDRYYGGGPFVFATLAGAELCYRRSRSARTAADAHQAFAAGNAWLATIRRLAPEDGWLPEQFDRETGAPASAKDLAWSHAATITALAARRRAQERLR
ncbi:MAG: glycoside hydrolase family 15 protein [Alphaproteobacteria bacterium]